MACLCTNSCHAEGCVRQCGVIHADTTIPERAHLSEFADVNQSSAMKWQVVDLNPGSLLSLLMLLNGLQYVAFLVFLAESSVWGIEVFIFRFPRISMLFYEQNDSYSSVD